MYCADMKDYEHSTWLLFFIHNRVGVEGEWANEISQGYDWSVAPNLSLYVHVKKSVNDLIG